MADDFLDLIQCHLLVALIVTFKEAEVFQTRIEREDTILRKRKSGRMFGEKFIGRNKNGI